MIADICIFACTGHVGTLVARRLIELATSPITILLAGRNVEKVKKLRDALSKEVTTNRVTLVAYPKCVLVEDEAAVQALVSSAHVVANCIDVQCHSRAQIGVAAACIRVGAHYLDLASFRHSIDTLFELPTPAACKSKIVPACGFDYAFMDVAVLQSEQYFVERYKGSHPDSIQVIIALRPGSLGFIFPLRLVNQFLTKPPARHSSHDTPSTSKQQQSKATSLLVYIPALSSWSIPWPIGAEAFTVLLCRRHWTPEQVDARLALPKSLWKNTAVALYALVVVAVFLPWLYLATMLKIDSMATILLGMLPYATLGFLSSNDELCRQSMEQQHVELAVSLQNNQRQLLCYHVMGPSPQTLNPLCMALASLELSQHATSDAGGIQSPALALGDTDFWDRMQKWGLLKVRICE